MSHHKKHTEPHVGVALLIRKNNKILLGYRIGKHCGKRWCCPGGHLELFEECEDCAIRETKEETDLTITKIKYLATANTMFKEEQKHYVVIFYIADWEGGKVVNVEPDQHSQWDWFTLEEMKTIKMAPGLVQLLDKGVDIFQTL